MKSKKLVFLLTLLIGFSSYSQSRITPKKDLVIGEFQSWVKGDDVSGWDFDKGEEWKERKGYLRVGDKSTFLDIYEKSGVSKRNIERIKSYTQQNFNEIGVIRVTYKGEEYVGFGIEKVTGWYRYPSIQRDWYTEIYYYVYLFKNDELSKLEDLDGIADLDIFIGSYGDIYDKSTRYQGCYDGLKYFFENGDTDNETLKIKKTDSDSEKVVRFLLPQEIKKYGDTKLIDFENHYFEVNVEKFNELLSLIKT